MAANKRSSVQKRIALFRVKNQRKFKRNTIEVDGRPSKTATVPRQRPKEQREAAALAYAEKREEKRKEKEKVQQQIEHAKLRAQKSEERREAEEAARVRDVRAFDNWDDSSMYDPEQAERDRFDAVWGSSSAFQPHAGDPLPPMIAEPRTPPRNPYYTPPRPPRYPRLSPGAGRPY